ncbi:hypothetical protein TNCT_252201 [Trichonephila clavata]|uniref:Uncharacterized protein n=1 Tax=Trichonephila clavata TaxID=2740835 RepID=A0A8X6HZH5_TRICU|nr:hypothetical protein TNCT_252201 [Trichonephila clavata]
MHQLTGNEESADHIAVDLLCFFLTSGMIDVSLVRTESCIASQRGRKTSRYYSMVMGMPYGAYSLCIIPREMKKVISRPHCCGPAMLLV